MDQHVVEIVSLSFEFSQLKVVIYSGFLWFSIVVLLLMGVTNEPGREILMQVSCHCGLFIKSLPKGK